MVFGMALAQEKKDLPKDVPPVLGRATIDNPGNGGDEWSIRLTVPTVAWELAGEIVPKQRWTELKVDVLRDTRTLRMGGPSQLLPSRVVDLKGKELPREEVLRRLARETPVLVSVSGKMVDPYYLQLSRPDTLIIILGPRDEMPAPELLPQPKARGTAQPKR